MPTRSARATEIAVIRTAQPRPMPHGDPVESERRLAGALTVPIEQIFPDDGQPRQDWEYDDGGTRLAELTESVREFGIMQPLVVREDGFTDDGRQRYRIIVGGRRRAAAERAGLRSMPVVVRGGAATQVRALQLVENLQRQDLSPLDEARAFQELMDMENLSPPMLAGRLHLSAQHVRDRLRVLADQVLADAVARRQIAVSTAREIAKLPDEERQQLRARVAAGEAVAKADIAHARRLRQGGRNGRSLDHDTSNQGQTSGDILEKKQALLAFNQEQENATILERKQTLFAFRTGESTANDVQARPDHIQDVRVGKTLIRGEQGVVEQQAHPLTDDRSRAADRLVGILAAWARTEDGTEITAILTAMRGHAAFDAWWSRIGQRLLRELL